VILKGTSILRGHKRDMGLTFNITLVGMADAMKKVNNY
jgi:hypothetical protein